jgi:hypothetical protein
MSSCDKVVGQGAAGAYMGSGQGCACVYLDATTGSLMVDGIPFAGGGGGGAAGPVNPTTGILGGPLNSATTVTPEQLTAGVLPAGVKIAAADVTGLCPAVLTCLTPGSISPTALGAGSLPAATLVDAASIVPGSVAGTVLTSTGTGTVWAAPAATPVGGPISPTSAGLGSGALNPLVTIVPSQLQPGALPAGTTIDAAQVTGTLPNSAIPCAAVVACVAAAPSGTITADKIGPGALQSGVTIPATSVLGGTAGQVLVSDGTKGGWATPAAGGGAPATAETLGGSVLKSTVSVPASQITGALPDAAIPCTAVAACVSAMPAGSIAADKLAPGTSGQVLTTSAAGVTSWATPAAASGAPTAAQIATAMDAATPATSPATATGIAQVYGENAAGAPVTASPMQVYEAAVAQAPASSAGAKLDRVSGVTTSGAAVDAAVRIVGTQSLSTENPTSTVLPSSGNIVLATVIAPVAGLYAVDISMVAQRNMTATTTFTGLQELAHALVIIDEGNANAMLYHSNSIKPLTVSTGTTVVANQDLAINVNRGTVVVANLKAGAKLRLELNNLNPNSGLTFTHYDRPYINLTKLADNDLVLV